MNILYICGSINQTSQMHQISMHLPEHNNYFTPYYGDGLIRWLSRNGFLEFTILGHRMRDRALGYMRMHDLQIDDHGLANDYDLVLTCQDLLIPRNVYGNRVILVQEGMTDPEGLGFLLVKYLPLPRYLASTAATGLSDQYTRFCVASDGYREHFIQKGVRPEKIVVTGIPNFDNCEQFLDNSLPIQGYVLAATTDMRETFRCENRRKWVRTCIDIAAGRQLVFKLHPNEDHERAAREIHEEAPDALILIEENIHYLIANCDVLITRFSSVVYVGMALGKVVYSDFDLEELRAMTPIQNGGTSARHIAALCREELNGTILTERSQKRRFISRKRNHIDIQCRNASSLVQTEG